MPNATYPFGILSPLVIISLPLWYFSLSRLVTLHWIRRTGLLAMMFILLLGGLVVSVKIGGGSDLHNLDAYLVLLLIVALYAISNQIAPDNRSLEQRPLSAPIFRWLLPMALIVPVGSAFRGTTPYVPVNHQETNAALTQIQAAINQIPTDREVLFMYQRPLIVFGHLKVKLVPEYENVLLFEAVFARNQAYLEKFYSDLYQRRFGLIVAESQPTEKRGRKHPFGEENDLWLSTITQFLQQHYQIVQAIPWVNLQIYEPKSNLSVICSP